MNSFTQVLRFKRKALRRSLALVLIVAMFGFFSWVFPWELLASGELGDMPVWAYVHYSAVVIALFYLPYLLTIHLFYQDIEIEDGHAYRTGVFNKMKLVANNEVASVEETKRGPLLTFKNGNNFLIPLTHYRREG